MVVMETAAKQVEVFVFESRVTRGVRTWPVYLNMYLYLLIDVYIDPLARANQKLFRVTEMRIALPTTADVNLDLRWACCGCRGVRGEQQ
jgi:hypothetical protein